MQFAVSILGFEKHGGICYEKREFDLNFFHFLFFVYKKIPPPKIWKNFFKNLGD